MAEGNEEQAPNEEQETQPALAGGAITLATEGLTAAFESVKQMTTLNAGSILLIGTFLKDIFPSKNGTLDVGLHIQLLIAASFVCFGVSLAFAAYFLSVYPLLIEQYVIWARRNPQGIVPSASVMRLSRRYQLARRVPVPLFAVGLSCFGLAVLLNLFR